MRMTVSADVISVNSERTGSIRSKIGVSERIINPTFYPITCDTNYLEITVAGQRLDFGFRGGRWV